MEDPATTISQDCIRRLFEMRVKKGLSHQRLADMTGLSRSYIGFLENGQRRPTLEVAVRLAQALGVRLSDVMAKAEKSAPRRRARA